MTGFQRDPVGPVDRELGAVDEAAGVRQADRCRVVPVDRRVRVRPRDRAVHATGRRRAPLGGRRAGTVRRPPGSEPVARLDLPGGEGEGEARRILRLHRVPVTAAVAEGGQRQEQGRRQDERRRTTAGRSGGDARPPGAGGRRRARSVVLEAGSQAARSRRARARLLAHGTRAARCRATTRRGASSWRHLVRPRAAVSCPGRRRCRAEGRRRRARPFPRSIARLPPMRPWPQRSRRGRHRQCARRAAARRASSGSAGS